MNLYSSYKGFNLLKFKIYIENKIFNQNNTLFFQLSIEIDKKKYKILRTFEDFQKLEQDVLKDLEEEKMSFSQSIPEIENGLNKLDVDLNYQNFSSIRISLGNYLKKFIEEESFITLSFINFIQFPEPFRSKYVKKFQKKQNLNINEQDDSEINIERSLSYATVTDKSIIMQVIINYFKYIFVSKNIFYF